MNIKGQNLIEFLLIVGLVVVVSILALTVLGKNINTNFLSSSNKFKTFQPFGQGANSGSQTDPSGTTGISGGSLGGSYDNPQQQCQNGTCDIDLGPYALSGIPSNFDDFVEVNGTSGGTEVFANLFEQLANQLKEDGDNDGFSEFMKMAELARMMGDMQKQNEQAAQNCKTSTGTVSGSDAHSCFQDYYNANQPTELRNTLNNVLTTYNSNATDHDLIAYNNIGLAKHSQTSNSALFEALKTTYPSFALVDTYDSIMSNSKYGDELKSITTKVYQNLSDLATNHSIYSDNYGYGVWDLPTINYDPITGQKRTSIDFGWDTFNSQGLSGIINPTTSNGTDIAAALLCTSSNNYLNGNDCAFGRVFLEAAPGRFEV